MPQDVNQPDPSEATTSLRLDERIYQELVGRIHSGELALGEKLPAETDLASDYSVSRPVIRAALARLRESGLVISKKGSGSYVSSGKAKVSGFSPFSGIDDISAYFDFRRSLERDTASMAARNPNPKLIADARKLLALMDARVEAGLDTVEADIQFHSLIAKMSNNRFQIESLQMLRSHTISVGELSVRLTSRSFGEGKKKMNTEHHLIINAIEKGDPAEASELIDTHLANSVRRMFTGE